MTSGANRLAIFGNIGSVFAMGGVGILFTAIMLVVPRILAPKAPNPIKNTTFEAGQVPRGRGKMHFMMQYYAYLLMFVVFDVMAMFLFAWAAAYQPLALGQISSWVMLVFVGALVVPMALTVHMAGKREIW
ncbi:MAG: NADH-quinone oxidoreductase subunit A [Nitrososphaerota archaeon]|nr:NADH-quinone oxidoreductase subunit A [Nitrososphaerota archaeon]MDG6978637.1 NADH-quinone oxidoreductase subunit A [Nitrososphaerota archaeon]MDG7005736.1 NADH-quinone oxidoreductase subunit A [Nitrososphaerota archaeon]MDG7021148.1 NADH-quinone oxidoreductase subunit A [Nitrososphaerota archaeon]MDG7022352.1 NADH-quinone oxidoreductase subunit A [Nitrososphaerota archaeon]